VLRWGILAPGAIAHDWADAVRTFTDQRITAVASRDRDRARAFAEPRGIPAAYGSYQHLLEDADVDVVYVAAPNSEHVHLAHAAIDHGKHVLVEKPMAMTAAEVVALGDHARTRGVFLMEAMWSRFLPQSTIIAQLLSDGALGELRSATADFSSRVPFDPTNRVYDPALGGGCLADLGVYSSWFVRFVLGPASSVVARGQVAPTGVEDHAVVVSEHADGAVGVSISSLRAASAHKATAVGENGMIEVSDPFWSPHGMTLTVDGVTTSWSDPSPIRGRAGLAYQVAAVAAHVGLGRLEAPEHPIAATVEVMGALETAAASIRTSPRG
jgi:predicted dehydrogenase